jgi:hypothetical protein
MTEPMEGREEGDDVVRLASALVGALRRDAAALESAEAPDLDMLARRLDELLARLGPRPDAAGRRALMHVLDEVQRFHGRVQAAHEATRGAIAGAAQRRLARQAYGEAERYARHGER